MTASKASASPCRSTPRSGGVPAELTTIHDGALAIAEAARTERLGHGVDDAHRRGRRLARLSVLRRRPLPARRPDGPGARRPRRRRPRPSCRRPQRRRCSERRPRRGDRRPRPRAAVPAATDVDRQRFEVWARQLVIDANRSEANPGFVAADVTTLEWILPRFGDTLDEATLGRPRGPPRPPAHGSRRRGRQPWRPNSGPNSWKSIATAR